MKQSILFSHFKKLQTKKHSSHTYSNIQDQLKNNHTIPKIKNFTNFEIVKSKIFEYIINSHQSTNQRHFKKIIV